MLEETALFHIFQRTPPRSAAVLQRIALDGWSMSELATAYGLSTSSAAILLFRALQDYHCAARGEKLPPPPLPDTREIVLAHQLAEALTKKNNLPTLHPEVKALLECVTRLHVNREAILSRCKDAAQASANSTAHIWLRRIAIVLILGLTVWFYWQERT